MVYTQIIQPLELGTTMVAISGERVKRLENNVYFRTMKTCPPLTCLTYGSIASHAVLSLVECAPDFFDTSLRML